MEKTPLTVFKASAGSGKTFTLAVEYIKLLIENPTAYRNTLAVTFTNKATEEMKLRILSQLNGLANGFADSDDYLQKIKAETGKSEETIKENARIALHNLLHDYSSFRVETIDKFFQRVLKNLARELELTANLHLELDDKQVEEMAVDTMIENLNTKDKQLAWLMEFILEKIREDKSWNIISSLKNFGLNIFKDTYKSHRKELVPVVEDNLFFKKLSSRLRAIRDDSLKTMANHAQRFFDAIGEYGVNDFSHTTSGVYSYFTKLKTGNFNGDPTPKRVSDCLESANAWSKNPQIIRLAENQLIDILISAEQDRRRCYRNAQSAKLLLNNINQLRLLESIEKMVRQINEESGRFLLSDTQGLLHALIGKDDAPFIFEKIGANLRNIMIDEFQDTGTVQWSNFKVLLDNCMAQESHSLIVGDVKQSIYRWRSGDWQLLNDITSQWNDDKRLVKVESLDKNFRSTSRVVKFNNMFFTLAAQKEYERLHEIVGDDAQQLLKAYKDVVQKIPKGKEDGGYVHVEMLPTIEYETNVMERIAETITSLINHGVAQKDIAILSRENREIRETASYFQLHHPEIKIVSDEAFRLDSSLAVNMIVTALRVVADEKDIISKAFLAKTWNLEVLGLSLNEEDIMLNAKLNEPKTAFADYLPEGFRNEQELARLRALPLIDLTETIYERFNLDHEDGQSPYVCAFYDIITEYLKENTSDVERFLSEWDKKLHKENIHGENVDGVRMLTIHRSKGLEFDNVILPFCNWTLEKPNNILWCNASEEPYNSLPIIPINFSKQMLNTVYEEEYKQEHLQNIVDNLNLLYVAFTRARTRLYTIGPIAKKTAKNKENIRSYLIEEIMNDVLNRNPKNEAVFHDFNVQKIGEALVLDYGKCFDEESQPSTDKKKEETKNKFLQSDVSEQFTMKSYPVKVTFRQSNNSREFTETEEAELKRNEYIRRGNLLHNIFSQLRDTGDIERVLRQLSLGGILYDEISQEELQRLLKKTMENKQVREWFAPHWTLHNECAIIFKDENNKTVVKRPDRVISDENQTIVIDFKFGKPHSIHKEQVETYIRILRDMGHENVKGYLWYVNENNVVNVD